MKRDQAIAAFGSVAALASALGVTVQAIYAWGDTVPHLRTYQIKVLLAERGLASTVSAAESEHAQ